jgi:simple sugar transport system ATP-binding protein
MALLELKGISKNFGGVRALHNVSASFDAGQVTAVVGDNGAGKSTLIKTIAGAIEPDSGEIVWKGESVKISNPDSARHLGIETVFQDLALVPDFTAAENMFFGRELTRWGLLQHRRMRQTTEETLSGLSINLPNPKSPIRFLSGGQRQSIAIGRAVAWGNGLVILDEPTAALGVQESRKVLDLILRMRDAGTTVILVSHNMTHVLEVAHKVVVMRRGEKAADLSTDGLTTQEIVFHIVGGGDLIE